MDEPQVPRPTPGPQGRHSSASSAPRRPEGVSRAIKSAPRTIGSAPRKTEIAPRRYENAPEKTEGAGRRNESGSRRIEDGPRRAEGISKSVARGKRPAEGAVVEEGWQQRGRKSKSVKFSDPPVVRVTTSTGTTKEPHSKEDYSNRRTAVKFDERSGSSRGSFVSSECSAKRQTSAYDYPLRPAMLVTTPGCSPDLPAPGTPEEKSPAQATEQTSWFMPVPKRPKFTPTPPCPGRPFSYRDMVARGAPAGGVRAQAAAAEVSPDPPTVTGGSLVPVGQSEGD